MDWLDLLAVQGTLKSLLQHHSQKASILWHLAFFMVQFSHPYLTTGKTIALTIWTFVDKMMSLLFNTLSRFVITFLPRSKRLLISQLQSPSAVILEPEKIKSVAVSDSIYMRKVCQLNTQMEVAIICNLVNDGRVVLLQDDRQLRIMYGERILCLFRPVSQPQETDLVCRRKARHTHIEKLPQMILMYLQIKRL